MGLQPDSFACGPYNILTLFITLNLYAYVVMYFNSVLF